MTEKEKLMVAENNMHRAKFNLQTHVNTWKKQGNLPASYCSIAHKKAAIATEIYHKLLGMKD